MNKPAQERIKRFWEWCGFRTEQYFDGNSYCTHYLEPDGKEQFRGYPPIDLNNLFQYAMPKLIRQGFSISLYYLIGAHKEDSTGEQWVAAIHDDESNVAIYQHSSNPALAFFWAIYKAAGLEE